MKRLPLFLLSAALSSTLIAGCGGGEKFADSSNTTSNSTTNSTTIDAEEVVVEPPSKPGKYGGTITTASISDPKTFNYWSAAEAQSFEAIGPTLDGLLSRNAYTQEWEGRLAELPKVSKDNLTFTFTLKPNLKWSDGRPLTADDVVFTLDVVYDDKVQTNIREGMLLDAPDGKGPDGNDKFKRVPLKYKKIDARTIEFKFPVPYAPAREILSFAIAPRHKLEAAWKSGQPNATSFNSAWGINSNIKDFVSSGGWILDSYVPGQRLTYKRNPLYWEKDDFGKPLPYLDKRVTLIVPDLNAVTLKFRSGETDLTSIQHTDYPSFKKREADGNYTTYNLGPSDYANFVAFNQNPRSAVAKRKPWLIELFRQQKFRQAIAHAINRKRIIDQVYLGLAEPLYGAETPANKQFLNPNIASYEYSPDKAKQLLKEIGLTDSNGDGVLEQNGNPVKFNILTNVENTQRKIMAAIVAENLRKVGLGVSFTALKANVMFAKIDTKPQKGQAYPPFDWEASMYSIGGGGVDPHNGRNMWSSTGNLHAWYPYQEKPSTPWEGEIDTIFREGAQQMDEAKRKAMYFRHQEIVAEQQPVVYTITPNVLAAVRNRFGNLKPSNAAGIAWNLDEWFDSSATRTNP